MTDQDGDRAYSDARRAEGSSRADGAGLAPGHQDPHDAVEQKHDGQRSRPHGPASHGRISLTGGQEAPHLGGPDHEEDLMVQRPYCPPLRLCARTGQLSIALMA